MSMTIRTNVSALNTHRNMKTLSKRKARSMGRLSSGFRINSASDDAAGLAISEKMRAQIRGLDQAERNSQDAVALIQTAEGGIAVINDKIHRLRELLVQAANDTYRHSTLELHSSDRAKIQLEINNIIKEINMVSTRTQFNNRTLLSGDYSLPFAGTPDTILPLPPFTITPPPPPPPLPSGQIPLPTQTIDFNNLTDGASGVGWNFSAGVLTVTGSGVFLVNGTGVQTNNRIVVAAGVTADLILNNVNVNTGVGGASPLTASNATTNLWLLGDNTLSVGAIATSVMAGIENINGNLTISGTGNLTAIGGYFGSGIGGSSWASAPVNNGGNITINGGNITATGGTGIGGGSHSGAGIITINGGTVTAIGGQGAGIGSGPVRPTGGVSPPFTIIINGGTVNATNAHPAGGAAIGGGALNDSSNIVITGGIVNAVSSGQGAAIGGGAGVVPWFGFPWPGSGGTITISGGIVNASSSNGAAIGGGNGGAIFMGSVQI